MTTHNPTDISYPRLDMRHLEQHFADGSTLWLRSQGTNALLRQITHQAASDPTNPQSVPDLPCVDLGKICPSLLNEFHTSPPNDRPGIIFFNLRRAFKSAGDFLAAVRAQGAAQ